MALRSFFADPVRRRRILIVGLVLVVGWLAFGDSHSLWRRARYTQQLHALEVENRQLREQNEALAARLEAGLSDGLVERVAREQYGMRRPGETVYRVTTGDE